MQTDSINSLNNVGFSQQYNGQQQYYQQNNVGVNWSQQSATLPNTASLSNSKFYLFVLFFSVCIKSDYLLSSKNFNDISYDHGITGL